MKVYFWDIDSGKTIDIGVDGISGMDVSPMDIPLKGDTIRDEFDNLWEVVGRQHYWIGQPLHWIGLYLRKLNKITIV